MSSSALPPEPWHSFLAEIDAALAGPVFLNCIGGFALTVHYGMSRPTADIDLIEVPAAVFAGPLLTLGREGGPLHSKYKLYIDPVTVAIFPENYRDRLTEIFAGAYKNMHIQVLDPYDVALTKLGRNNQKDRDDLRFLARAIPFDIETLKERYLVELQWQFGDGLRYGPRYRADRDIGEWIEMIREDRSGEDV
jgi:hypothetical protein